MRSRFCRPLTSGCSSGLACKLRLVFFLSLDALALGIGFTSCPLINCAGWPARTRQEQLGAREQSRRDKTRQLGGGAFWEGRGGYLQASSGWPSRPRSASAHSHRGGLARASLSSFGRSRTNRQTNTSTSTNTNTKQNAKYKMQITVVCSSRVLCGRPRGAVVGQQVAANNSPISRIPRKSHLARAHMPAGNTQGPSPPLSQRRVFARGQLLHSLGAARTSHSSSAVALMRELCLLPETRTTTKQTKSHQS